MNSGPLMERKRVAVLATHPVQYQVPWFRALSADTTLDVTVLYAFVPTAEQQGVGFGIPFQWDVPLLDGYHYELLKNVSQRPALSTFGGCDTPGVSSTLRRLGAQALVVNGWHVKSYLQALAACRRSRIPCIVRGDSNALKSRPLWVRMIHRFLLRQYSAFLVVGQSNRSFYEGYGLAKDRLFAAPHCVDNAFFGERAARARGERVGLRERWGLPPDAFVLLFAGKLIDKKRPLDLLQAAERARASGGATGIHVLVAGDGPLRAACEARLDSTRLPGSILGFVNQTRMPEVYAAADALVLPSDYGETWGLVVNEAMACGLPAIVSDRVGCHPDLIQEGRTGATFSFGSVEALANLISSWAADRTRTRQLGENAQLRVGDYSVRALVLGTLAAVEHVTRGH